MSVAFLIIVIGWIIFSTVWDGRTHNRERILAEMQETYSKREVLNLIFETKREVLVLFLAYGFLVGIAFAAIIMRR